jgi:hypothetical protein
MTSTVNTAKVVRRKLELHSIDEVLLEIDRIVAADQAGSLQTLGNWAPGQILGHVAAWANYSYDGYPHKPPPWFVRIALQMMIKTYLRNGMLSGQRIPGVENGTYGTTLFATTEGADQLRRAMQRLLSDEVARFDSPTFGAMSHEDRIRLNLRHAELHLSFLKY